MHGQRAGLLDPLQVVSGRARRADRTLRGCTGYTPPSVMGRLPATTGVTCGPDTWPTTTTPVSVYWSDASSQRVSKPYRRPHRVPRRVLLVSVGGAKNGR